MSIGTKVPRLGTRVHKLRTAAGLSCEQLSKLAGMSPSYIGNLERGDIQSPSARTLLKIAKALRVSMEFLVSGKGAKS
jgi:transcriptional regulator with XRE-family HTH domain